MKNFIHHDIPLIERIDGGPTGRLYQVPNGNKYPSVSTVVGFVGDKTYLEEWRKKVGNEVADKISKAAADRGTLIHDNCERFLLGKPLKFTLFQHVEKGMFDWLLPVLNDVDNIHGLETQLYSDKLEVAGTVDLIGEHQGKIKVIDWKNSRRFKTKEEIPGYFAQMAAYAYMFWERTGIPISDMMVAMTVEDYGLLTFDEKVKDHLPVFIQARNEFKSKIGV